LKRLPGCGKSTVLEAIELLGATPLKSDSITPASIYHLIDSEKRVLLVDEADNLDWFSNSKLRAVVNSGHSAKGRVIKMVEGEVRSYSTFAPLAIATLDRLPLPLIKRSIIIRMQMTPTLWRVSSCILRTSISCGGTSSTGRKDANSTSILQFLPD
jgi:hypothetical protein